MSYRFKRSSEVYIVKEGVGHRISALADFSLSQTIAEKTINRRNQFSRLAPKQIINRTKNTGSGSIDLYFNKDCPALGLLIESLDFLYNFNGGFTFNNFYNNIPKHVGLVVRDSITGETTAIPAIFITNMDVRCSPNNINKITFGFVYSDTKEDYELGLLQESNENPILPPSYIDFRIFGEQINSVRSAAFTITRNLRWLSSGATQFNLNDVAVSLSPVITEYNITATASANDNNTTEIFNNAIGYDSDIIIGNNQLFLALNDARVTTRKEPSEVFSINFDIKHQSLSPVLLGGTYNGYIY